MEQSKLQPQHFVHEAVNMGALEGKIISPVDVSTAEWVRRKCQYGCGGYGQRLTCPPYSPTPHETQRMLDEYDTAVLIRFASEEDNLKSIMAELERKAFLSGFYKTFAMGAGPCDFCDECEIKEGCVHPDKARPSMEAAGIDVYKTVESAGFPLHVVTAYDCPQNYYGLLLLE